MQILPGFFLAVLVSTAAYFARSLTVGGAVAAALLGTVVFGLGGVPWAIALLVFFISSSLWSHFLKRRKADIEDRFAKTSCRDQWQVLANGAVPGLAVLAHLALPQAAWPWLVFSGALAAVNADTWATEVGILAKSMPRLITTGKKVERGASGGVSLEGTLAAAAGAFVIGLAAAGLWQGGFVLDFPSQSILAILVVTLAGLVASLVDSWLGATWQALYFCPACRKETERHPLHGCGASTVHQRGLKWMNNDLVNAACSLSGALIAAALGLLLINPAGFSEGGTSMSVMQISTPAFQNGSAISVTYSCDGGSRSPAMQWGSIPQETQSLALIMDDPDAPGGTFTHWVVYNLPPTLPGIPEGIAKTASIGGSGIQGLNSYGRSGYDGPCPPRGSKHRYYFKVYALDLAPNLPAGLDSAGLQKAMQGHTLAQGQWMGVYKR